MGHGGEDHLLQKFRRKDKAGEAVFVSDIISAGGRDKERDKGSVTSYFSFFRRAVGVSFSAVHLQNVHRWVKYCQLIARKYNQFMITEKYIQMIKKYKIHKQVFYLFTPEWYVKYSP
jgi:hypothetical protein